MIRYETESLERWDRTIVHRLLRPELVWTYSKLNMDFMKQNYSLPSIYLPPGYSKVVDYRNHRDNPLSEKGKKDVENGKPVAVDVNIGVMTVSARVHKRTDQLKGWGLPFENVVAWSHAGWAANVTSHHVLLNTHKPKHYSMEMFRIAPALSSGMRVISEHANKDDEDILEGLVFFAEKENMKDQLLIWLKEGKDHERRREIAAQISETFKQRFPFQEMVKGAIEQSEEMLRKRNSKH